MTLNDGNIDNTNKCQLNRSKSQQHPKEVRRQVQKQSNENSERVLLPLQSNRGVSFPPKFIVKKCLDRTTLSSKSMVSKTNVKPGHNKAHKRRKRPTQLIETVPNYQSLTLSRSMYANKNTSALVRNNVDSKKVSGPLEIPKRNKTLLTKKQQYNNHSRATEPLRSLLKHSQSVSSRHAEMYMPYKYIKEQSVNENPECISDMAVSEEEDSSVYEVTSDGDYYSDSPEAAAARLVVKRSCMPFVPSHLRREAYSEFSAEALARADRRYQEVQEVLSGRLSSIALRYHQRIHHN